MAIKPEQVGEKVDLTEAKNFMDALDIELLNYKGKFLGQYIKSFDMPWGLMEWVKVQYEEQGWVVYLHSDQRDGSWIELRTKDYDTKQLGSYWNR